jgi:hypothetical protein
VVSGWLGDAGTWIATGDAGAIHYFADRPTVDVMGLNMPELYWRPGWAAQHPVGAFAMIPCWFQPRDRVAMHGATGGADLPRLGARAARIRGHAPPVHAHLRAGAVASMTAPLVRIAQLALVVLGVVYAVADVVSCFTESVNWDERAGSIAPTGR